MHISDKNPLEQFLGLWLNRNGNVLLIKSLEANTVKVSFASGKTKSPVKLRFSPVAWQHISFIGKYEFYNGWNIINIQQLIENIIANFKIDISSTEHELQKVAVTNRSFS